MKIKVTVKDGTGTRSSNTGYVIGANRSFWGKTFVTVAMQDGTIRTFKESELIHLF